MASGAFAPEAHIFCAPHSGAVAPQRRKIRYRPEAKPRGDFGRPMRAAIPILGTLGATDLTGFSKVSHFAWQNGTLIRRPRWRARASEMRGAGGARPRTFFAPFMPPTSRGALSYCKLSAASEAKQRTVGDAEHPFDDGMTTCDTREAVKDSIYLPTRTKAVFSLESEGFLFDKTKRNLSEMGRRDLKSLHPPPCGRAAGKCPRPPAGQFSAWAAS